MTSVALEQTPLTTEEQDKLSFCETLIDKGLQTFVDTGNALLQIRDEKLYRGDFATFQDYCRERWQIGRTHAYRLMDAAEVARDVPEVETERQARELVGIENELRSTVFEIAKATAPIIDGKPDITSGHLKAVGEVLTAIIEGGGMDDGSGEMKPLGVLLAANVTEHVYERMQRQQEAIKEKREAKTRAAIANGNQKEVPALPPVHVLMAILRDLVKGIERANADRGVKMHPALTNPYHFGKAFIGEPLGELSVLVDDVAMISTCQSCADENVAVRDTALTITKNSIRSLRIKLCAACIAKYQRIIEAVPEGEAAA